MEKVAVVYLSWIPYGIDQLKEFLKSYKGHSAGVSHQLIFIFNGVQTEDDYISFLNYAEEHLGCEIFFYVMEKGQDIDAYFYVANNVNASFILFLNTYSRILSDNWLLNYANAFNSSKMGLVSATASGMSYYSAVFQKNTWKWEFDKSFHNQFRKYKLLIKASFYWRYLFKAFPNYHLRTNAFMIRREIMLTVKCPHLSSKFKAYLFESGVDSLTNQILKMNLDVNMIDRNGMLYDSSHWKNAPVFWNDKQQLLMIADNQTEKYINASKEEQRFMTYLAWGTH